MSISKENIAYFDNAATTFPKPQSVYEFMNSFYITYGGNVGRGHHIFANKSGNLVEDTRLRLLNLFHAENKNIIFTPSATEAMNVILQGISWQDGMNVYISPFEHNAVIRVLHYLKKIYDLKIIQLEVDKKQLSYEMEKISYQFQEKNPNVVVLSHASNVCGIVAPIKQIFDKAKKYNSVTVLDMAQTAGLIDMNLNEVQVDCAVFAGHKTLYGPFGISGFFMDKKMSLRPLLYGGTGVDSANLELPNSIPERYEVGSMNILGIAGLNAALRWIEEVGIKKIYEREQQNRKKLLAIMSSYENIKVVLSKSGEQIGVVSCVFEGYSSDNIGQILDERNIAVRTGLHCAPLAHKFLNTFPEGTVRFSVNYFTCDDEFEQLKKALDYIEENS